MATDDDAQRALIDDICTTELRKAPDAQRLLRTLFEYRHTALSTKELALLFFGPNRYNEKTAEPLDGNLRQALRQLRVKLNGYLKSDSQKCHAWLCDFPDATPGSGYSLHLTRRVESATATMAFWQAHIVSDRTTVIVCNEPLFFRDWKKNLAFRYLDINPDERSPSAALDSLQKLHPASYKKTGLYPSYPYLISGEIGAYEMITQWFTSTGSRTERRISRRMLDDDIRGLSLILLGTTRTNRFIRRLLAHRSCRYLRYRLQAGRARARLFAEVQINKNDDTTNILDSFEEPGLESYLQDDPSDIVFGVVTRIPNPYGDGSEAITIISADFTHALEEITRTITSDPNLLRLNHQSRWPVDHPLVGSFEQLYSLQLDPSNIDAGAYTPKLLGWRTYK